MLKCLLRWSQESIHQDHILTKTNHLIVRFEEHWCEKLSKWVVGINESKTKANNSDSKRAVN